MKAGTIVSCTGGHGLYRAVVDVDARMLDARDFASVNLAVVPDPLQTMPAKCVICGAPWIRREPGRPREVHTAGEGWVSQ